MNQFLEEYDHTPGWVTRTAEKFHRPTPDPRVQPVVTWLAASGCGWFSRIQFRAFLGLVAAQSLRFEQMAEWSAALWARIEPLSEEEREAELALMLLQMDEV